MHSSFPHEVGNDAFRSELESIPQQINTPAYVRESMSREQNGVADDPHDSTSPKD